MGYWVLATVTMLVALAAVVVAQFLRPVTLALRRTELPHPDELTRLSFPVALRGYNRDHVDATLSQLADAYTALFWASDEATRQYARQLLTAREVDRLG